MTALTVGANQQYHTIHDAVAASKDGDTIYVQAGTYVNDFATINHKINLIGVGGMVQMVATKLVGKGDLVVNNDLTIDHFEFSGVKSYNYNGAGIRYQAGNLTVTNSYFHDNQDGILATPLVKGTGSITITNSEFAHNGQGDGQSHNMYIGTVQNFTITDSYSHDAVVGHEIKSRAVNTTITDNRIDDGNGNSSYSIDLPDGGNALVANNIIRQGVNSQNKIMISYAAEQDEVQWGNSKLVLKDNTIINEIGRKPVGVRNFGTAPVTLDGNTVYGLTSAELAVGTVTSTDNKLLSGSGPAVDTSHPWSGSTLDHIVSMGIGDDVLIGTAQKDLFVGGAGQDVFVISPGGSSDTIADFKAGAGAGDVVSLQGTSFNSFTDMKAAMSQHGSDVWLALGKGEVLTFQDHKIDDFAADDFTFTTAGGTTSGQTSPVQVELFKLSDGAKAVDTIAGTNLKNDLLTGTSKADSLDGKQGADTMQGGAGDDHYAVDNAKDVVIEKPGEGVDTVVARVTGGYTLPGNVENLILGGSWAQVGQGNELDNKISSLGGGDSLLGMGGNDILIATKGSCVLTGGQGDDIFHLSTPMGGMDKVTDFTVGTDLLDLTGAMKQYTGVDPVADGVLTLRSDGHGGTIMAIDPTHSGTMQDLVDVQNIAPSALHMGYDYVF